MESLEENARRAAFGADQLFVLPALARMQSRTICSLPCYRSVLGIWRRSCQTGCSRSVMASGVDACTYRLLSWFSQRAAGSRRLQKAQVGCRGPTRVENHGTRFWGVAHLVSSIRVVWVSMIRRLLAILPARPRGRAGLLSCGGPSWDDADWEDWTGGMAGG